MSRAPVQVERKAEVNCSVSRESEDIVSDWGRFTNAGEKLAAVEGFIIRP